jgi:hypothetical protein
MILQTHMQPTALHLLQQLAQLLVEKDMVD